MPRFVSTGAPGTPILGGLIAAIAAGLVLAATPGQVGTQEPVVRAQLAGAAPAVVPATPAGLPSGIEDLARYVRQASCDPGAKPGAQALGRLLTTTYPGTSYGISRACGADGIASEHYEGRALDWMVSVRDRTGAAEAAAALGWLFATDAAGHPYANARRLGIMYVIWNNRIWGAYNTAAGWRPYSTCAAHPEPGWDTSCHRNHIHFSLSWAGAMGATSFWSRRVAAADYGPCRPKDLNWAAPYRRANPVPCPTYPTVTAPSGASATAQGVARFSGATIGTGSAGPAVSAVQRALGLSADGAFGPATGAAVSAFRTAHRLPAGTGVDQPTWHALVAAFVTGSEPISTATPPTRSTAGTSAASGGGQLSRYRGTVLRYGDRGPAVLAMQRTLRVTPATGWFGPVTRAAVLRFQRAHGIPTTGNVGPLTWRALGA